MGEDRRDEDFGCEDCWPEAADAAWSKRGGLTRVAELIDESHFHVMILECGRCTQRFISIFTETIDWSDGDDPQYWQLMPINGAEAAVLIEQGHSLDETKLDRLGPGRRSLHRDYPSGGTRVCFWSTGISVGPHD